MNNLQRATLILALGVATLMTACGRTKTVTWEEEVPLNTGETILVKRSGTYTYKSEPGNPLKYAWGQDRLSTIEFTYHGKGYTFTDTAVVMLLAIDANGMPSLIADAGGWGNQHGYPCVTPYYVQFRPDATGKNWVWPHQVDPWFYGLSTNLLFGLPPLESDGKQFSPSERIVKNASLLIFANYSKIDPRYKPENCVRRK